MREITSTYLNWIRKQNYRGVERNDKIKIWRDRVFNQIVALILPTLFIALIPSLIVCLQFGFYVIAAVDILVTVVFFSIVLIPFIPIQIKKVIFISNLYMLGIFLIAYMGTEGPGLLFLLCANILSLVILGRKTKNYFHLINLIVPLLFVFLIVNVNFQPVHSRFLSASSFIAISFNFLFIAVLLSESLHYILKKQEYHIGQLSDSKAILNRTIYTTKQQRNEINETNKILVSGINQHIKSLITSLEDESLEAEIDISCKNQCYKTLKYLSSILDRLNLNNSKRNHTVNLKANGSSIIKKQILNYQSNNPWAILGSEIDKIPMLNILDPDFKVITEYLFDTIFRNISEPVKIHVRHKAKPASNIIQFQIYSHSGKIENLPSKSEDFKKPLDLSLDSLDRALFMKVLNKYSAKIWVNKNNNSLIYNISIPKKTPSVKVYKNSFAS